MGPGCGGEIGRTPRDPEPLYQRRPAESAAGPGVRIQGQPHPAPHDWREWRGLRALELNI